MCNYGQLMQLETVISIQGDPMNFVGALGAYPQDNVCTVFKNDGESYIAIYK